MQVTSTSTQRTYRYVRLSLVGAVVLLGVALALTVSISGPLESVSAAYFTPARDIFIGTIFAIALALLALSGRSLSQALLDYAALLAPLIALVPTARAAALVGGASGQAPITVRDLAVSVPAFVIVATLGVLVALVLALVQRTLTVAVACAIAVGAAIVAAVALWWMSNPQSFVEGVHTIAATLFFVLIAAVAALAAWGAEKGSVLRRFYAFVAGGIALALVAIGVVIVLDLRGIDLVSDTGVNLIFIGEAIALLLFAAFWMMQTIEFWNDPNPTLRVASRP